MSILSIDMAQKCYNDNNHQSENNMSGPGIKIINCYALQASSQGSKTASVADVTAEALRSGHMRHIDNPQPPVLLYGTADEIAKIPRDLEDLASTQVDKSGNKQRVTTPVLATAIYSYPVAIADLDPDDKSYARWLEKVQVDAKEQFGKDRVKGILLHLDEEFPHVHVLAHDGGRNAKPMHPGLKAKAEGGGYKAAMRSMLDRFHEEVGKFCGLLRHGPKGRSLSREEWKSEVEQGKALANVLNSAETIKAEIKAEALAEAATEHRNLAGQIRDLNREVRELERKRVSLTEAEQERLAAATREREELKAERKSLDVEGQRQRELGAKIVEMYQTPDGIAAQRLAEAEQRAKAAIDATKTAVEGRDELQATLDRTLDSLDRLRSVLTPDQRRNLSL